jgi:succinoglycan biosynthesis transport protein ExoP
VAPLDHATSYGLEPQTREHPSLLSVLRRRALIIVGVTILAGVAAGAFAYATRDTYESTAKLLFRQTLGNELNALGLLPGLQDADHLAQSAVEVVDSRRVAGATAAELRQRGVDMSTDAVVSDVTVSDKTNSDVVEVVGKGSSARRAALLTEAYSTNAARLADRDQREIAARALDNLNQQLNELPRREREAAIGASARLRSRIEKMRVLAEVGNGTPQIIQPAYVPTSKAGNPIQTILLGLLFGLVLGVGLALLREQADRRLHRAEDVSTAFVAPVLTTVPRNRALKRHVPFGDLPPEIAEAFRMLQMNLRFGQSGSIRSVLVTSARAREGKTTVAWNLASATASSGLSVALVEADMRRPSLAAHYGLESEPGLSEVVRGQASIAEAVQAVLPQPSDARVNGHPRPLHVLVAGQPPSDPWALMQSAAMVRVLETLRRDHDFVVIDTPPIPHVADAISLLRRVDGVIVTASVNSTRGPEAERLRDQLQALDARILGVVANGGSSATGYAAYPAAPPSASARPGAAEGNSGATAELSGRADWPDKR